MGTDLANDSTQPLTWISSLSNSIYRSTEKLPAAWGSRSQSCWPFCWHLVRSYCFSDRLLVRQPVTLWLSLECLYAPFLHLFQIALLRFCCYSCGYMKSGKCVCVCGVIWGSVFMCVHGHRSCTYWGIRGDCIHIWCPCVEKIHNYVFLCLCVCTCAPLTV